jgi:hypothetical protein
MDDCLHYSGGALRRPAGVEWFRPSVRPVSFLRGERESTFDETENKEKDREFEFVANISKAERVSLADRFEALKEAWHRECGSFSSTTQIAQCPSYRIIISDLGKEALPFIFKDLEKHRNDPDHWFVALREITKEDPVPATDRGNHRAMAKAWLRWARSKGHEW